METCQHRSGTQPICWISVHPWPELKHNIKLKIYTFCWFKPLIQHKSAANRHQNWVKITIFVFSTADYIVLRIKIVIDIRPWQCQPYVCWQEKIQSLDSVNCLILGLFSTAVKYISLFNVVVEFEAKSLNELIQIIQIIQILTMVQMIHSENTDNTYNTYNTDTV